MALRYKLHEKMHIVTTPYSNGIVMKNILPKDQYITPLFSSMKKDSEWVVISPLTQRIQ